MVVGQNILVYYLCIAFALTCRKRDTLKSKTHCTALLSLSCCLISLLEKQLAGDWKPGLLSKLDCLLVFYKYNFFFKDKQNKNIGLP